MPLSNPTTNPIPSGTNNIGDVDVATLPTLSQLPVAIGQQLPANSLSVAIATGQVVTVSIAPGTSLPAGTNNIGDVDVLTLPMLPAGTNNIGDIDVLTLPALPGAGFGFQTTVGTTEVTLAANAVTIGAILKADDDNTDSLYFRYTTGVTTTNGFRLKPGQSVPCPVSNTNLIRCISGTASQKVHCAGA